MRRRGRARTSCCPGGSRRARSSPHRTPACSRRASSPTRSTAGISRVLLISHRPAEAPQLALQVAGRLAEALEARRAPVDRVDLNERVDQLLARSAGARRGVERVRHARRRSPRPRSSPSRRTGSRSSLVLADREHVAARAPACHPAHAAGAPRAARRARSAAAAGAVGGAAPARCRPRARSGRSRWSGPRRSGSASSSPLPSPCASRNVAQRLQHEQRRAALAAAPRACGRCRRARSGALIDRNATRRAGATQGAPHAVVRHTPQHRLRYGAGATPRARFSRRQSCSASMSCPFSNQALDAASCSWPRLLGARRRRARQPALASHSQAVYFEASSDLLNATPARTRSPRCSTLGVKALRVELYWDEVAPGGNSATKPNFDATNPAATPGAHTTRSSPKPEAQLESAADRHLAGAALGDLQQARPPTSPTPTRATSKNS